MENYEPEILKSEKLSRLKPIAVIGPRNTPRMQAQLGVHTIIHRDPIAIELVGDGSHVKKILIPSAAKVNIKKELELMSYGQFQLFPELQTIGKILRDELF